MVTTGVNERAMAKKVQALPTILIGLAAASAETVARRWWMMASGGCSPAEYQRMAAEKVKAALQSSAVVFSANSSLPRLLHPWLLGARRNAARLRRTRRARKRKSWSLRPQAHSLATQVAACLELALCSQPTPRPRCQIAERKAVPNPAQFARA